MKILAIFNAKGGVAKTTTTVNLAAGMAALGARVLVVDLDYQGNATSSLGFPDLPQLGSYDLITGKEELPAVLQETFLSRLSLVGATANLAAVDVELALRDARHDVLRRLLAPCADDYDVVLLDCPPAMGVLTVNALVSCSAVLIPCPPEPYAHDGLMRTWSLVTRIRGDMNTDMAILGVLPTMVRPQHLTENDGVLATMRAVFGTRVAPDGIPREDALFSRAADHCVPVCILEPDAPASLAYLRTAARLCEIRAEGGGGAVLHCLDDPAPDAAAAFQRALERLHRVREQATTAELLAAPQNKTPIDPAADLAPSLDAEDDDPPRSRLPVVLGGVSLSVLSGIIGFAAGWFSASGVP